MVACQGASETQRTLVRQRIEVGLQAEEDKLELLGRVHKELVDQLAGVVAQAAAQQRGVPAETELTEQLAVC